MKLRHFKKRCNYRWKTCKCRIFSDWKEDAARRDFSINSIYSDKEGNLFDPYDGKKDLENGTINFIGECRGKN